MELVRWLVTPVVLAAVVTGIGGCTPDSSDRGPGTGPSRCPTTGTRGRRSHPAGDHRLGPRSRLACRTMRDDRHLASIAPSS